METDRRKVKLKGCPKCQGDLFPEESVDHLRGWVCLQCGNRISQEELAKITTKPNMKALSGYAEFFWLMAKNWKDVENRNWPLTRYIKRSELPVRIYLHASKTATSKKDVAFIKSKLTAEQRREFEAVDWGRYRGKIIGEVTITDEVTFKDIGMKATHSPWFFGEYGFVVRDGVLYERPMPCRGQLGFFEVDLEGIPH